MVMKKIPPIWSSGSKWFVPFHMCVMALVFLFVLLITSNKAHATAYDESRYCLAQNIYFEAGNQPLSGKLAVANVTMNRVEDLQFPETICGVVYDTKQWKKSWLTGALIPVIGQCQFSWFCDGKADIPKDSITWLESIRIADIVLEEDVLDITDGALWYHADYIHPYWADHLERLVTIENHIFYK